MDAGLVFGAALMGLAGTPHCLAMCGATSTAAIRSCGGPAGRSTLGFHAGRLLGYAAAGAAAASGMALLRHLGDAAPALRALWTLLHLAMLGLGAWLLLTGRQPAWLSGQGPALAQRLAAEGWRPVRGPLQAAAAGSAWVAWPCGLLQSALVVAALASSAPSGALVMATFAAVSSIGLVAGPALMMRWIGRTGAAAVDTTWAVRVAGALLAAASAWALGHGLWERVVAWCGG
jgi:uncharacterized protein